MKGALVVLVLTLGGCLHGVDASERPDHSNPFLHQDRPIRVRIDHVDGVAPAPEALDALSAVMGEVGPVPSFDIHGGLPSQGPTHDLDEILLAHASTYDADPVRFVDDEGRTVLHVLYFDGNNTVDAAGLHLGGLPLLVVFPETLPSTSLYATFIDAPVPGRWAFERAVLLHEYGHVLGLVGCGLPEQRPHGEDCHSSNDRSVMFPAVHTEDDVLTWALDDEMKPIWRFDDDDWNDIRAGQRALRDGA